MIGLDPHIALALLAAALLAAAALGRARAAARDVYALAVERRALAEALARAQRQLREQERPARRRRGSRPAEPCRGAGARPPGAVTRRAPAGQPRAAREAGPPPARRRGQRPARELHDSVSQALFAASRTAEVLPQLWELDPDAGRAALLDLRRFVGGAIAGMRALRLELRPRALAELPLHETLGSLLPAAASQGPPELRAALEPAPLLPPDVQVALYRIAQEALSNVGKHAGARRACVVLRAVPELGAGAPWRGTVRLTVADDGRGFDPGAAGPGHLGLTTMRAHAADIGASLNLASAPGAGTAVTVTWRGSAPRLEEGQ